VKKPFEPNFSTPSKELCREELNKLNAKEGKVDLFKAFRDDKADMAWEAEQIAKSNGIYLEFDRAKTGQEKDWMYMIRVMNPGGGPLNRNQWLIFDELSEKYTNDPQGNPSLRLTTRQNIQFHWVKKQAVLKIIKLLAHKDIRSLNGCGDNTRNVMGCPLSRYSDIFNACQWTHRTAEYFQLPLEPFIKIFAIDPNYIRQSNESFQYSPNLLNRKFKIGFSTIHRNESTGKLVPDNCVELLTNDLSIAPLVENDKVVAFQVYVGGGQGERNGKPSMATLGQPFCITSGDQLMNVLDAVVQVHQEWGDRQNRFWARMKYVVQKKGIEWYRDQVSARLGSPLEKIQHEHDYGDRQLHLGWQNQPSNGLLAYGAYIENGRITDHSPNGKLKTMIREIMQKYDIELMVTPNQDILFMNIPREVKEEFEADLKSHGFGQRNGQPYSRLRLFSGACVGRDTCRLTYTDSEKLEPILIDELEQLGWGDMAESIGITGCERQCFRPATKSIGLIGTGLNRYQFKLFGVETARFQGQPLMDSTGEHMYLRSVPREKVVTVINALFKFYKENAQGDESLGEYHRRIGADIIIHYLKENISTSDLMHKPFNTDCVID